MIPGKSFIVHQQKRSDCRKTQNCKRVKELQNCCSLENMYKELASDIDGFQHPGHGDLTGWAEQGV